MARLLSRLGPQIAAIGGVQGAQAANLHARTPRADNPAMFSRSRKQCVAWIALLAVIFAALLPARPAAAGATSHAGLSTLGTICTSHGQAADPTVPADSGVSHSHCAFCALGAWWLPALPADVLLATLRAPASAPRTSHNHLLPHDRVAVHPLIPRAPPCAA